MSNSYTAPPPSSTPNNGHFSGPNNGGGPNSSGGGWGRYETNNGPNQWQNNNGNQSWQGNRQQQQRNNNQWQNNNRQNSQYQNRRPQSQQSNQQNQYNQQTNQQNPPLNQHSNKLQYTVLYTHQKTKKKPTWKDGRLVISSGRATLYDASPLPGSGDAPLDSLEVSPSQAANLTNESNLESEKYLIQIEGPWRPPPNIMTSRTNHPPSAGMKKILTKKFVAPKKVMPNFEQQRRLKMEKENKRRRVLQPGELERMYYSGNGGFDQHGCTRQNNGCGEYNQNYGQQQYQQNGYDDNGSNQQNAYNNQGGGYYNNPNVQDRNFADRNDNGLPQRGFNQNNNSGSNTGQNQRSQNAGGPMAFQSNGIDASGFYQEEEDEEEEDWTGNNQNTGQQGMGGGDTTEADQNTARSGLQNDNEQHSQHYNAAGFQNNEQSIQNASFDSNQQQSQQSATYDQLNQTQASNGDDQRVTNDLLALLGVTSAPQEQSDASNHNNDVSNEQSNSGASYQNEVSNVQRNTSASDPASSNSQNNKSGENRSSFLAGLEAAENDLDDDQPMAFDFNKQDSFDCQDDYDDGESFNLDDELANDNDGAVDAPVEKEAPPITGLSLPDPVDSSSDDDSLAE